MSHHNLPRTPALFLCGALVVGAPLTAHAQDRCDERRAVNRELSTDGVRSLDVVARQGSLEVRGQAGLDEIRVTASLCAEREEDLALLDARLERVGSTAELEAVVPEWTRNGRHRETRVDLIVTVPRGMDARIRDGSGNAVIEGLGELDIGDGSGNLTLRDIDGDLTVHDGSGSVRIESVGGSVWLEDGSGNAVISRVDGSVELSDGSGMVEISDIGADVHVTDKGSGLIRVDGVGGDLRVEGTRRERIRYSDVHGSLDLPPARRPR